MAVNLKQTCYYKSILRQFQQEGRGSAVLVTGWSNRGHGQLPLAAEVNKGYQLFNSCEWVRKSNCHIIIIIWAGFSSLLILCLFQKLLAEGLKILNSLQRSKVSSSCQQIFQAEWFLTYADISNQLRQLCPVSLAFTGSSKYRWINWSIFFYQLKLQMQDFYLCSVTFLLLLQWILPAALHLDAPHLTKYIPHPSSPNSEKPFPLKRSLRLDCLWNLFFTCLSRGGGSWPRCDPPASKQRHLIKLTRSQDLSH